MAPFVGTGHTYKNDSLTKLVSCFPLQRRGSVNCHSMKATTVIFSIFLCGCGCKFQRQRYIFLTGFFFVVVFLVIKLMTDACVVWLRAMRDRKTQSLSFLRQGIEPCSTRGSNPRSSYLTSVYIYITAELRAISEINTVFWFYFVSLFYFFVS